MRKLNLYFFGEEQITLEDALYFYGSQGAVIGFIAIATVFIY